MRQILLTVLSSVILYTDGQDAGQIKHVTEGDEYNTYLNQKDRQSKSAKGLCSTVPENKYKDCDAAPLDNGSFYDFHSEDIHKINNVSFSHPDYVGQVLLVVNLASF